MLSIFILRKLQSGWVVTDWVFLFLSLVSFVDPLVQFESQLQIIELSFRKVFSMPSLSTVKAMGRTSEDTEDLEVGSFFFY